MDAAKSKLSASEAATKTVERSARELVRGSKSMSAPAASASDALAAGANSIADIEKRLIAQSSG